jgi:hypothetical protein
MGGRPSWIGNDGDHRNLTDAVRCLARVTNIVLSQQCGQAIKPGNSNALQPKTTRNIVIFPTGNVITPSLASTLGESRRRGEGCAGTSQENS